MRQDFMKARSKLDKVHERPDNVVDELTALGDQNTSDVLEQENDQMVDPEYSLGMY